MLTISPDTTEHSVAEGFIADVFRCVTDAARDSATGVPKPALNISVSSLRDLLSLFESPWEAFSDKGDELGNTDVLLDIFRTIIFEPGVVVRCDSAALVGEVRVDARRAVDVSVRQFEHLPIPART